LKELIKTMSKVKKIQSMVGYFTRSIANSGQAKECPYCNSKNLVVIDKKYLVTTLLKCNDCNFNHRHPKDSKSFLNKFYQTQYTVNVGMMTTLPTDEKIEELKNNNFNNERSYKEYISALFKTNEPIRILDYGCSWGYNVFKLNNEGFIATGYEVSKPRVDFGVEKLNVPIVNDITTTPNQNNLVINSHVIEHLPDLSEFFDTCKNKLTNDGILMCFCPNGNQEYRDREPHTWHVNWGGVHPNYLTAEFAQHVFKNNPYLILTDDWVFNPQLIANWDGVSQVIGDKKEGKELLIITKPNTLFIK